MAVSGGPDSLALLLLAAAAFPGRVCAATVDHGLREESAEEAAFVAECCAQLGVPHDILAIAIPPGNVSDRARTARYAALSSWSKNRAIRHVATAHHADDQAETLLMRLNRGSGVAGLAGVRRVSTIEGTQIVRPLLSWRKAELERLVREHDWKAVDDPSSTDPRYDRARLRRWLAQDEMLDIDAVANSAAYLAEADEALDWAAEKAFVERVYEDGERLAMPHDLPKAVALRVIVRTLAHFGEADRRGSRIARLHDALKKGEVATLGSVVARPGKNVWRFGKALERQA